MGSKGQCSTLWGNKICWTQHFEDTGIQFTSCLALYRCMFYGQMLHFWTAMQLCGHWNCGYAVCLGIIRFTQLVKMLEKQDAEVQRLNSELRSIVLPRMSPAEEPAVWVETQLIVLDQGLRTMAEWCWYEWLMSDTQELRTYHHHGNILQYCCCEIVVT